MQPSRFEPIKITPCCGCRLLVSQIIDKTIRHSKFRCLSEATPYYHNVFTFTLLLPEGRAGVAWESSEKNKVSLGFKGLKLSSSISSFLITGSILKINLSFCDEIGMYHRSYSMLKIMKRSYVLNSLLCMWDFKFSRRRVWCSELSSLIYCRVKWLSTDVSEVRTASIIRSVDIHFTRQYIPEDNSEHPCYALGMYV
jgi:hypothetical protein